MVNSFTLQTAVVGGAGDDWYMYVWFMCMMSSVNDQRSTIPTESHFVSCAPSEPARSEANEIVRRAGFSLEVDVKIGLDGMMMVSLYICICLITANQSRIKR